MKHATDIIDEAMNELKWQLEKIDRRQHNKIECTQIAECGLDILVSVQAYLRDGRPLAVFPNCYSTRAFWNAK